MDIIVPPRVTLPNSYCAVPLLVVMYVQVNLEVHTQAHEPPGAVLDEPHGRWDKR